VSQFHYSFIMTITTLVAAAADSGEVFESRAHHWQLRSNPSDEHFQAVIIVHFTCEIHALTQTFGSLSGLYYCSPVCWSKAGLFT
jgi:hypothetical protein